MECRRRVEGARGGGLVAVSWKMTNSNDKKKQEKLGKIVNVLINELAGAYHLTKEYRTLYMSGDAGFRILTGSATNFFANYLRLYWSTILLTINRLLDPKGEGSNKNATFDYVIDYAAAHNLGNEDHLRELIKELREKTGIMRKWRSKVIAHVDLKHALRNGPSPFKTHIDEVTAILDGMAHCLQLTYGAVHKVQLSFHSSVSGGTEAILGVLRDGLTYRQLKAERMNPVLDAEETAKYGRFYE